MITKRPFKQPNKPSKTPEKRFWPKHLEPNLPPSVLSNKKQKAFPTGKKRKQKTKKENKRRRKSAMGTKPAFVRTQSCPAAESSPSEGYRTKQPTKQKKPMKQKNNTKKLKQKKNLNNLNKKQTQTTNQKTKPTIKPKQSKGTWCRPVTKDCQLIGHQMACAAQTHDGWHQFLRLWQSKRICLRTQGKKGPYT